jgi:hypothetical protein
MSQMKCSTICGHTRSCHIRWPDQIPGIGWEQGTELDWLQRVVSYSADELDWRAWERRLNALIHFTWQGIHFVHQRAASGRRVPLIRYGVRSAMPAVRAERLPSFLNRLE